MYFNEIKGIRHFLLIFPNKIQDKINDDPDPVPGTVYCDDESEKIIK
jgi:hypothetical protein